ncbi:MAG: arsenate reductase [Planctomycetes bacterium]|nr:arsenate reductase [Planctomycetota bacterium]
MNNVFIHLGTCNTCKKILAELGPKAKKLESRELKSEPLTGAELDALKKLAGSYEALFSRRSQQIKTLGLDVSTFGEKDYRKYILEHYSFLKRPVIVIDGKITIGKP